MVSSIVALKLNCAFGASGLERIGLENGGLEMIDGIWRRLKRMGLESGGLDMINCIWRRLERTGLESKKLEVAKSIWLERARADWLRALRL